MKYGCLWRQTTRLHDLMADVLGACLGLHLNKLVNPDCQPKYGFYWETVCACDHTTSTTNMSSHQSTEFAATHFLCYGVSDKKKTVKRSSSKWSVTCNHLNSISLNIHVFTPTISQNNKFTRSDVALRMQFHNDPQNAIDLYLCCCFAKCDSMHSVPTRRATYSQSTISIRVEAREEHIRWQISTHSLFFMVSVSN